MKRWAIAPAILIASGVAWFVSHKSPEPRAEVTESPAPEHAKRATRTTHPHKAISAAACRVNGTLSGGSGRSVRVYSEVAHADVDAELDETKKTFSAELPEQGAMHIVAVASDGRTAELDALCEGSANVALTFPPARKTFASISGRCIYLETGAPAAGARVFAEGWSTLADDGGKFAVRIAGGPYRVRCAKDGDESEAARIEVVSGEKKELELQLAAATSVLGRVIDASGSPVEGAQVSVRDGKERTAVSDASGSFQLRGVAPGPVIIDAQSDGGFAEKQIIARLGLPYAEVELVLVQGTRGVYGQITDEHGVPIENASVRVFGPLERAVKTDADGRFTIGGLADAAITLRVEAEGYTSWERGFQPEEFGHAYDIRLLSACTAKIRVLPAMPKLEVGVHVADQYATGETGEVIEVKGVRGEQTIVVDSLGSLSRRATITATVCPTDQPVEVSLEGVDEHGTILVEVERTNGTPVQDASVGIAPLGLSAKTDARGTARFLEVPLGWHDVVLNSERESVEVKENEVARVKLVVHDDEGEVSGYVTAFDRPVEGAAIRATCGSSGYPRSLDDAEIVARSNGAGAFAFDPKEGSVCTVRAEHADEGTSDAVVLRVGGLPAELEIRALKSIDGVVLERESGAPVTSYQLSVTPLGRTSDVDARSMFVNDSAGQFHLDGLAPGLLSIAVRSDQGRGHVEVDLSHGESASGIEIRVLDEGVVTGRVVANNVPLSNARVQLRRVHTNGWSERLVEGTSDGDGRFALRGRGGDALRVLVSREGFYPYGTPPFDFDALSAAKDLGDLELSPRSGRDEKEGGIGIQFAGDPHGVRVVDFVSDSPAREAGLEVGDVITAIDGTPAGRLPLVSWLVSLRGPVGTSVVLEIERGTLPRFSVSVIRRAIGLPDLPDEER